MPLRLQMTVTDTETGEVVAQVGQASFPWRGATWDCEPFDKALPHFLSRHARDLAREVLHCWAPEAVNKSVNNPVCKQDSADL